MKEIHGKTGDLFSLHFNFMILDQSIPPVPIPPPPRATLGHEGLEKTVNVFKDKLL